jgi:hypothetical protein
MFSPLHNHLKRKSSTDGFDETSMFETVHDGSTTIDQLRRICHYLLRVIFPGPYAKWRMDNGYVLPDASNIV